MRAVLVPFGGQTVTFGNFKAFIGWVVISDDIGWFDHCENELLIWMEAIVKLAITLIVQRIFPHMDSALLMWTSP